MVIKMKILSLNGYFKLNEKDVRVQIPVTMKKT